LPGMIILVLAGCASQETDIHTKVGKFVYAGPISVQAPVLSMKWRYGFSFSVDPASVTGARLSCASIPGTKLTIKKKDLNISNESLAFWDSLIIPVSKNSTPWLYTSSTTESVCRAVISVKNSPDMTVEAPLIFTKSTKSMIVQQMKEAHKYNKGLKK